MAPWSLVQHYELWPTPLLDVTTSLRAATSFALGVAVRRDEGFVYVFALDDIEGDVMELDPRSRFAAVRLSAVCPPSTIRPHLQEGCWSAIRCSDAATSAPTSPLRWSTDWSLEHSLEGDRIELRIR